MSITTPSAGLEVLALRVRIPRNVVHRAFPAETVVLNLDTGLYHGLNTVAGDMLKALERAATVAEAAQAVAAEYPSIGLERIQRDICTLCRQLQALGLVELEIAA